MAAHLGQPGRLLVLKHHNPFCLHYHAAWGALIFSSRYLFLRKAFGHFVRAEALEHDQLLVFDTAQLARLGAQPLVAQPGQA